MGLSYSTIPIMSIGILGFLKIPQNKKKLYMSHSTKEV